ncbi:hypothetical protein [Williamsia sp. D3]|uniref:hypothetical protein n=1 Tax=Williamsia sp. D3 TaxID=1313067 RepID=UPI0003D2D3CE|nr:hypothetical protein [Williamsia sp. D3]ETD31505.1 hypothetical protein W823_19100 [Williamsia sp. D3]
MSALSDLLNRRRGDRSVREIGRAATNYGVGESTVIPYFSGKHGTRPPEKVLAALAAVLDIRIEELREAAGKPVGEREPYRPPEEANLLDQRQRRAVDELIRSIVASRGATDAEDLQTPAPAPRTPGEANEDQEARRKGLTLIPGDQGEDLAEDEDPPFPEDWEERGAAYRPKIDDAGYTEQPPD